VKKLPASWIDDWCKGHEEHEAGSVAALRSVSSSTLVAVAVAGRLVSQQPSEEPALSQTALRLSREGLCPLGSVAGGDRDKTFQDCGAAYGRWVKNACETAAYFCVCVKFSHTSLFHFNLRSGRYGTARRTNSTIYSVRHTKLLVLLQYIVCTAFISERIASSFVSR